MHELKFIKLSDARTYVSRLPEIGAFVFAATGYARKRQTKLQQLTIISWLVRFRRVRDAHERVLSTREA